MNHQYLKGWRHIVWFLSLLALISQEATGEEKALLLQKGKGARQFELFYFPYPDSSQTILHLTLSRQENDLIKIEESDRQKEYRSFLEDELKVFDQYLIIDPNLDPGFKYKLLTQLIESRGPKKWTFDDLIMCFEKDSARTIDEAYFKQLQLTGPDPSGREELPEVKIDQPVQIEVPLGITVFGGICLFLLAAISGMMIFMVRRSKNTVPQTIDIASSGSNPQENQAMETFYNQFTAITNSLKNIDESLQKMEFTLNKSTYLDGENTYPQTILSRVNSLLDEKQLVEKTPDPTLAEIMKRLEEIKSLLEKLNKPSANKTTSPGQDW